MCIFLLNITDFVLNMTGFVLEILVFFANMTWLILDITVLLLHQTEFINNNKNWTGWTSLIGNPTPTSWKPPPQEICAK